MFVCAAAFACQSGQSYVHKNQLILDALPTIAGAQRVSVTSSHYKRKDCEEPVICAGDGGYETNAVYTAPAGMGAKDIADFYAQHLAPLWSAMVLPQQLSTGTEYTVSLTKGTASVGLVTGILAPGGRAGTFTLSVDYDANRK